MSDEGSVSVDRTWKPQTKIDREGRTTRIVQRLREGSGCEEVARQEKVTVRRVRQIIAQYLKDRETPEGANHVLMQIDRLGWAMRVASEAMTKGDIRAVRQVVTFRINPGLGVTELP